MLFLLRDRFLPVDLKIEVNTEKKGHAMSKTASSKVPQIRKDRNYACVYANGRKFQLGRYGTPEADAAYREFIAQWAANPTLLASRPQEINVERLCLEYLDYAKENDPSHYSGIKTAIKPLLYGFVGRTVESLDSRAFLYLQSIFVEQGLSRQYCNILMGYVRAMLKWGIVRKLAPKDVYFEAKLIEPLKKGKTKARENKKRQDVSDKIVNQTLPHLLPTIRDMVQVQRQAGMRPSEVYRMKAGEIDTKGYLSPDGVVIWIYTPGNHKNSWRENGEQHVRQIPLGKPEQDIIAPRLVGKSDTDYIFSPKETVRERTERDAAKRKSKVTPSQKKRKSRNAKNPKRRDRDSYGKDSYNRAIKRSIDAANKHLPDGEKIPYWTPYQLRHSAVTKITLQTGSLDIARAVAGQKTISVTQGYNHADLRIAIEQAVQRSRK